LIGDHCDDQQKEKPDWQGNRPVFMSAGTGGYRCEKYAEW
jgi:predicted sulfurtransferase